MNAPSEFLTGVLSAALFLTIGSTAFSETPGKEAHVTRIIKDVKILPTDADARPAVMDDEVQEGTAVRTGDESRSELTFDDLTITRLGANTVYSFDKAGRNVQLQGGTILLRVPKDSGGAQITTSAVTVGITGTTVIFAFTDDGQSRLIALEGAARMSLNKYPRESKVVRAGQRLDVGTDATKLPAPVKVDIELIMRGSPLITEFPPLPSEDLILDVIRNQNPHRHVTSLPSGGGSTQSTVYPNPPGISGGPPPPPSCWCCINGQVVQATADECRRNNAQCYGSQQEARRYCGGGTWWCCIDGKVVQVPEAQARVRGGTQCYASREEAIRNCLPPNCWCCIDGQVVQSTEAYCRERGGQCYLSRKEALKNCRGVGPTPTPTYGPSGSGQVGSSGQPYPSPTPYRPRPTPTPYQPRPTPTVYRPRPTPTPTPTKPGPTRPPRYPVGRPKPTPTPTPQKIY